MSHPFELVFTKTFLADSPSLLLFTLAHYLFLSVLLMGHKPFGVIFASVIFLVYFSFVYCWVCLHGISAHLHQHSLLFPWEPLARLIKARFMQATQSNLTHLFFYASVGFSNVFSIAERTKPFVHLCCG